MASTLPVSPKLVLPGDNGNLLTGERPLGVLEVPDCDPELDRAWLLSVRSTKHLMSWLSSLLGGKERHAGVNAMELLRPLVSTQSSMKVFFTRTSAKQPGLTMSPEPCKGLTGSLTSTR